MTEYRFHAVRTSRTRSGACPECGKRVRRSKTFEQTVNPFNRNDDGSVRTPREVRAQVEAKADAWEPDLTHERCRGESDD